MSNCTCGKTTRPPMCDGSHWLSEEEYKERSERLSKLFKKEPNTDSSDARQDTITKKV
jgi:CDGSH-type Zn-finger protein